jgi:chromosomal replication initiator protein
MADVQALERMDAENSRDSALDAGAIAKAWAHVRGNLRRSAGQRLFDQWLKPIVLIESQAANESGAIRLGLPSAFMTQWVSNHYAERMLLEFRGVLPGVESVSIETLAEKARTLKAEAPSDAKTVATPLERPAFDPRFTFERFVIDTSNRVAFNAAAAVSMPGAPQFSPLYLHSATGQGKTHLMHAIGHAFLEANPQATAIYMPAERFMFEFVQALRAKDTHSFKARLRGVDLLMIDDLQFIGGKDATQEEFFHTVNEFMSSGKRLVIAADRAPQALEGFDPRLAGRLALGWWRISARPSWSCAAPSSAASWRTCPRPRCPTKSSSCSPSGSRRTSASWKARSTGWSPMPSSTARRSRSISRR